MSVDRKDAITMGFFLLLFLAIAAAVAATIGFAIGVCLAEGTVKGPLWVGVVLSTGLTIVGFGICSFLVRDCILIYRDLRKSLKYTPPIGYLPRLLNREN